MADESTAKRKSKDSLFTHLFRDTNNVLTLYKQLHPEDTTVTIDDINIQTLETVFINTLYNDLGFIVNENGNAKLVMLVEAQSVWNPNMTLRMLFYLTETYRRYIKDTKQSEHTYKRVKLPKPELYVVYSGSKNVPDEISLQEDFFEGTAPIDLKVKILSKLNETIYGQYIGFCKVYDEQRKLYDNSVKCIEETIRICIEKNYLSTFLGKHKGEVVNMMAELFDEQAQREQYDVAVRQESKSEGIAIGKSEGIAIGKSEGIIETLIGLVKKGILTISQAAEEAKMTVAEFEDRSGLKKTS